jgi:hypothetical protein
MVSHSVRKRIVTTTQCHKLNLSPELGGKCRNILPSSSKTINPNIYIERCSVAIIKFHKMFSEETPLMVRFLWMSNIWGRNEPTARISKVARHHRGSSGSEKCHQSNSGDPGGGSAGDILCCEGVKKLGYIECRGQMASIA